MMQTVWDQLATKRVISHSKGRDSFKCVRTFTNFMQFFYYDYKIRHNACPYKCKKEWVKKFKGTKTTNYRVRNKVKINPHAGWMQQELNLTLEQHMKGTPDSWLTRFLIVEGKTLPITLGQMWVIFKQSHDDRSSLFLAEQLLSPLSVFLPQMFKHT